MLLWLPVFASLSVCYVLLFSVHAAVLSSQSESDCMKDKLYYGDLHI